MLSSGPLSQFKRLLRKREEEFSLIELVVVVAVLSILSAIAIPTFNCFQRKAKASTALAALRQIQTECAVKKLSTGSSGFYSTGNIKSYQIQSDGSNSCNGNQFSKLISARANDPYLLPNFTLATNTHELSYNFKGKSGKDFKKCFALICDSSSESTSSKYSNYDFVLDNAFINNECSDYVILEANSWEDAESKAQLMGGNLVTINTEDEYKWLQENVWLNNKLLNDSKNNSDESTYYFTGLNDTQEEGKYVWSSGQGSEWNNNEDLIHRQNWIAQQHMANSHDYFVIGGTNDHGFTDYTQDYRPELYNGQGVGTLTWVDNESSWLKNNGNPPHYGLAEIPSCKS